MCIKGVNNRSCQTRPKIDNINSSGLLYRQVTLNVNKCGGSWDVIVHPYARVYMPNK